MGNLQSHLVDNAGGAGETSLQSHSERVISCCDFDEWKKGRAEQLGFSTPCLDYHTIEAMPYTSQKCYTIEVTGTRRRTVEFRRDLGCYSGEMEHTEAGGTGQHAGQHAMGAGQQQHLLHIRQLITGQVTVISLSASHSLPELDYMVDPVLTVLAYHCHTVVFSVKDKTKNIPKVVLFCDITTKRVVGHFTVPVNYNNLSGVLVSCSSSVDGSNFVVFVMEDHYDEFNLAIYALQFKDGKPTVRSMQRSGHSSWYEPNLHTTYLGMSNDSLVALGDYPLGLTYSDPCRYLLTFDLVEDQVAHCVALKDSLYPVCVTSSSDGTWVATLSRDPNAWEGDAEGYVVRLYTAELLLLSIEIKVPLSVDNFNTLSHCTKIMFSHNSALVAVASSDTQEDFGGDFYGYCGGMSKKGTKGVQISVYRLPVVHIHLKALCRDTILAHCQHANLKSLPLPCAVKSYLSYVDVQGPS